MDLTKTHDIQTAPGNDIPPRFYDRLQSRISAQVQKNANVKHCWKWIGATNKGDGYGHVILSIKGDRMTVNAHRAAYIAFRRVFILPFDISHLCHDKLCMNPDHLSHEPWPVNQGRKRCKTIGECAGHTHDGVKYEACIL